MTWSQGERLLPEKKMVKLGTGNKGAEKRALKASEKE